MAGSSNFLQWNPGQLNQESDVAYAADSQRSGGATDPSAFLSILANKLFYQNSTFAAAFAQSLANKGYVVSDANFATLVAVFANVLTKADNPGAYKAPATVQYIGIHAANPYSITVPLSVINANTKFRITVIVGPYSGFAGDVISIVFGGSSLASFSVPVGSGQGGLVETVGGNNGTLGNQTWITNVRLGTTTFNEEVSTGILGAPTVLVNYNSGNSGSAILFYGLIVEVL